MPPPAESVGTPESELDRFLDLARSLAIEAGELVQAMRSSIDLVGETKSSIVDIVTEADRAAEALITGRIEAERPDDEIIGEEGTGRPGTTGVRWIIDPIDGTTNYVYGVPSYGVSIGVEVDGQLVVGVVYEPTFDRCYAARAGGPATKNGTPITVNRSASMEAALLATGFGYVAERRHGQAEVLLGVLPRVRDIRRFGSAALDLCYLAEGQVDGYFERGLNLWDVAAGLVIARAAGAAVGNLRGGEADPGFTLAANPALFEPLRALLVELDADQKP